MTLEDEERGCRVKINRGRKQMMGKEGDELRGGIRRRNEYSERDWNPEDEYRG
jgi:hypothetical protein